ncbi:TetR/AcrR family transcriptional regulator [Aeribacillus sp. FSL M8-0254]|uniref:TetR/AcrR family transcriptional regulator n=1 Tax=Aeribacillus sp. FSL M8-0254 TaxID=2954577 RepID=UPI0030F77E45
MARNKGEESKKKIFQAAAELFAHKGFHATKISDIVAKAGLTQAAFYLYFNSKEEIFEQMLEDFEKQLIHFSDAGKKVADIQPEQVKDHVRETIVDILKFLGKNPHLTKVALRENKDDRLRSIIVEKIAANMSNNQRLGIVKTEIDTQFAGEAFLSVIEHIIERYVMTGEKTENELADQVSLLFLEGILNKN